MELSLKTNAVPQTRLKYPPDIQGCQLPTPSRSANQSKERGIFAQKER